MDKTVDPGSLEGILSSSTLFSTFSGEELSYIAEKSELVSLPRSGTLFEPGSPGDRLFLIISGSILVYAAEGGSVLAELVPGDSFGELELLTSSPRNARALAERETRLLAFPRGGMPLEEALADRPNLAARIFRSFLLVVSGRTRKANALVKENSPIVRELKRQVYGDKLTSLYNKAYLTENLGSMLQGRLALVMMKPDNFKEINDRFGHEAGDSTLILMAAELAKILDPASAQGFPAPGTAVRYDGNELAAILPGLGREEAIEAARSIQERFCRLDLHEITGDSAIRLSLSLGIVLYPEHGSSAEALIKASAGLPLVGRQRGGSLILFPEDAA